MPIRLSLLLTVLVLAFFTACSGGSHTDVVLSRINAVENNLLAAVVKTGNEPAGMALSDRMEHFRVPGVSVAVINEGRIEWAKGYGMTESGGNQAITADTVFQACSMSKPVSVTGIMLLAQSGVIDISGNVNDYLRSWQVPDNGFTATEKVTIQRLMSHTGGINVSGFDGYPSGAPLPTLVQILDGVAPAINKPVRVVLVPGSQYSYSGGGMEILHLMAEDVTGVSFRTYMRDSLFRLLGMNSSDFVQPMAGPLSQNAAKGHDLDGATLPGGWSVYPELIAAGLWTTPSDLARVIVEVQKASTQNQGAALTRQTAVNILTKQPNSNNGSSDMGLGFNLINGRGGLILNHSGANMGYKGFLGGYSDRGQGVVVMTNGDNGIALALEVLRSVARVYGWPDFRSEQANLIDLPLSVLEAYEGNYTQTGGNMTFQVYMSGGGLMMRFHTAERLDMYPTAADTFLMRGLVQGTVTFTRDIWGNVIGFTAVTGDGTFIARK
jgi:CubicO group peptidase (beta-lactamase class C family)